MSIPTTILPSAIFALLKMDPAKVAAVPDKDWPEAREQLGQLGFTVEQIEAARDGQPS